MEGDLLNILVAYVDGSIYKLSLKTPEVIPLKKKIKWLELLLWFINKLNEVILLNLIWYHDTIIIHVWKTFIIFIIRFLQTGHSLDL